MDSEIHEAIKHIDRWTGKHVTLELLDKGLTNHIFKACVNDDIFVLRIPGVGTDLFIDRDREIDSWLIASEIGVAPEVVEHMKAGAVTIARYVSGTVLSAEMVAANTPILKRIIDTVKTVHSKAAFQSFFDPFVAIKTRLEYAERYSAALPSDIGWMLSLSDRIEQAMKRNKPEAVACHNDLNPENFIDDGIRLWLIDWEYAGQSDPFFDLGNFRAEVPLSNDQEELVIKWYCGEVNYSRLCRMRLYKIIADLSWGLWAIVQSKVSRKDFDFHQYGLARFESLRKTTRDADPGKWISAV